MLLLYDSNSWFKVEFLIDSLMIMFYFLLYVQMVKQVYGKIYFHTLYIYMTCSFKYYFFYLLLRRYPNLFWIVYFWGICRSWYKDFFHGPFLFVYSNMLKHMAKTSRIFFSTLLASQCENRIKFEIKSKQIATVRCAAYNKLHNKEMRDCPSQFPIWRLR